MDFIIFASIGDLNLGRPYSKAISLKNGIYVIEKACQIFISENNFDQLKDTERLECLSYYVFKFKDFEQNNSHQGIIFITNSDALL
mgnify:CR=1 FL=1